MSMRYNSPSGFADISVELTGEHSLETLSAEIKVDLDASDTVQAVTAESETDAVSGLPAEFDVDGDDDTVDFEVGYKEPILSKTEIHFVIEYFNDYDRKHTLHLPSIPLLQLRSQLTEAEIRAASECPLQNWAEAKGLKDPHDLQACWDLAQEAVKTIPLSESLRIVDYLAGVKPGFRDRWQRTMISKYRNWLLANSHPSVTSREELVRFVDVHNGCEYLPQLEIGDILGKVLEDIETLPPTQKQLAVKRFELGKPEAILDRLTGSFTLAVAMEAEDIDTAREVITHWPTDIAGPDTYDEHKQVAKNNNDPEESAQLWLELLMTAGERHKHEFVYVAANYLYWTAEEWSRAGAPNICPKLYDAAATGFGMIGNQKFAQEAQASSHQQRGYKNLNRNPEQATAEFQKATALARGECEFDRELSDYTILNNLKLAAITGAEAKVEKAEFEEAIEEISEYQDEISELENVDEDTIESVVQQLRAKETEITGDQHVVQANVSAAISSYDDAKELYWKSKEETPANVVEIKRDLLQGYRDENQMSFDEAANKYDNVAEKQRNHFDSAGTTYSGRATLCRAKQQLIEKRYEEAIRVIRDCPGFGDFYDESRALLKLCQLLNSYHANETISPTDVLQDLENMGTKSSGPDFAFQSDYSAVILFTAAVDQLESSAVPQQTLEFINQVTIEETLAPELEFVLQSEVAETTTLHTVKISDKAARLGGSSIRRQRLPTIVNYWFEEAEIKAGVDPVDYDDPVSDVLDGVELMLRLIAEFHGPQIDGSDWRKRFGGRGSELTLGSFKKFLNMDEYKNQLRHPGRAEDALLTDLDILPDAPLSVVSLYNIRNKISHPNMLNTDRDEFITIRNQVGRLIDSLAGDIPVIMKVLRKRKTGPYRVRLLWRSVPERALLQTDANLTVGNHYFLNPKDVHDMQMLNVKRDDMVAVQYSDTIRTLQQHKTNR